MKPGSLSRNAAGIILLFFSMLLVPRSFPATQWQISTLHSFGFPDRSANGFAGLMLGRDGRVYGTFELRGPGGGGAVFRCNENGSGFEVIHAFSIGPDTSEGYNPVGNVVQASDGRLYGTTISGGANLSGTVYSLKTDGTDFRVIYQFELESGDVGPQPFAALIEGTDGMLYGTTRWGGATAGGTVFRLGKDGSGYEVLHAFDAYGDQGTWPEAPVFQASDGALYGCAEGNNDPTDIGKIFKLNTDGSGYELIHDFATETNQNFYPNWGLIEGRDGALYGTVLSSSGGAVFKLQKDGSHFRQLAYLSATVPTGPLRLGPGGRLYGFVSDWGMDTPSTLFSVDENGFSFRKEESLGLTARDVRHPAGAFAMDSAGNIFGTSSGGGRVNDGTLFRCATRGGHQILHTFDGTGGDGGIPNCRLSRGTNGMLCGTTAEGGFFGKGTLFEMNADGTGYKILLNLLDAPVGVVADPAGSDLYLTTIKGALFRVTGRGKTKLLHRFRGGEENVDWIGVPLVASDGFIYGMAKNDRGSGIIYRISRKGTGYRVLYNLTVNPLSAASTLMEASDGFLYGTYSSSSDWNGPEVTFRIAKDGSGFAVLSLTGDFLVTNSRSLTEGSDGMIYGTGGFGSASRIYRMDKNGGNPTILHTFSYPISDLVEGQDGALYGISTDGLMFRLGEGDLSYAVIGNVEPSSSQLGMVRLPNGSLCGVISAGGEIGIGRAFRLDSGAAPATIPH